MLKFLVAVLSRETPCFCDLRERNARLAGRARLLLAFDSDVSNNGRMLELEFLTCKSENSMNLDFRLMFSISCSGYLRNRAGFC